MDFDYEKLPEWWREAKYTDYERLCREGKHVPAQIGLPDGSFEYGCQNCGTELTDADWHKFFDPARKENHGS